MLKWNGSGFLDGIPARDLNDDELEKYGGKAYLLQTGLFEEVRGKVISSKKKDFVVPPDIEENGQGE